MKKIQILTLFILSCSLYSCRTKLDSREVLSGEADFSTYVAVGNSLTAGYQDGALYLEGQENSYPMMLARQFELAGGGAFNVPFMPPGPGNDGSGFPRRKLAFTIPCNSTIPTVSPIYDSLATAFDNVSANGPFNLVGVPGIRMVDCNFPLYSSFNPYLTRFCQTPGTSTLITEATRKKATFFSFWLGSNDALLYALQGAPPTTPLSTVRLSDTAAFSFNLNLALQSLTAGGAKGVIANVPDITSIPYFTTVPWNSIFLDSIQVYNLKAYWANQGATLNFKVGNNGFLIVDSSSPGNVRLATSSDYILLTTPSDSVACFGWGTLKPLADEYVLDATEAAEVQTAILHYNAAISAAATKYNLAFVDMFKFLKTFKSGIIYNNISLNANYVTGGAFSLDGVHPNQRGYAFIANEFIKAINGKYKSTLPMVDPTQYSGIKLP